MSTLALNIQMQGKTAVVIGGGAVALRKIRTLLSSGAAVRVVAVSPGSEIVALANSGAITLRTGAYQIPDLNAAFLVVAATDDAGINAEVAAEARKRGILIAVADKPTAGDCTFPAKFRRGDLEIAVSTGGRCPAFAVDVRNLIEEQIGSEYGDALERLAREREKLLTNGNSSTYNARALRSLARHLLAELTERKELLP